MLTHRRDVLFALALAAAALIIAGVAGGGGAAQPSIFWGAYVGGGQYGLADAPWDLRSLDRLESAAGKRLSLVEWGQAWHECSADRGCGLRPFRADLLDRVRLRGAIPVLSWGSYAEGRGAHQPAYSLAQILSGRYDAFIRRWARGAKAWGHPFFLRFDWEMNTNSVPYSEAANGNRPGEFVHMWRHVHEIFRRVGARNVTWVWCPNVAYPGSVKPLARLYPGRRYVNWACLDGYNWGGAHWRSFASVFGPSYRRLARIAPGKPVMIGETASTEAGGSKAAWIAQGLGAALPHEFARVKGVVWFDKQADGMDWPLASSTAAVAAFRQAIDLPVYAANGFAHLPPAPIRPLTPAR